MDAMRQLLWWCSVSKQCHRQRVHRGQPLELASGVDFYCLQLRVIEDMPDRGDVFTDADLDNLEVPPELYPPESWARAR